MKKFLLPIFLLTIWQSCKKIDPPTASFSYEIDANDPLTVKFTNTSQGEIDALTWHFGDGTTAIDENPTHTYSAVGSYTVSLKVDNKAGSDTHIKTIYLQTTQAEPPSPPVADGDAILVAANIASWQSGVKVTLAGAVASFSVNGSYVDVGTVKINNNTLTQNNDNTYFWLPSNTSSFSGNINWFVSGGNGFSMIDTTITTGFPSVEAINSSSTLAISSGYTLSTSSVSSADSVLFVVSGPDGSVEKMAGSSTTSYTFSASDLANIGTGNGVVTIAPFKYAKVMREGYTWYYINEEATSKNITINP